MTKKQCGHRENAQVRWNRLCKYSEAFQGVKIHLAFLRVYNDLEVPKGLFSRFPIVPAMGSGTHGNKVVVPERYLFSSYFIHGPYQS